jgi:Tfp pilus assembly protein PilW
MKTHTQQQTNLEKETTATEPKLSSRKRLEYRPRKWRGNTLVPVIIALAISAIATVAFLNQGANLAADNKKILAQNQISSLLGEWSIVTSTVSIADVRGINLPLVTNNTTVYGAPLTFTPCDNGGCAVNQPNIQFTVDTAENCTALFNTIRDTLTGIASRLCITDGANPEVIRILRINLN